MKTPAGRECKYFFGDYHRGRNLEECRLLQTNRESEPWKPSLCATCPVPDILIQNACPHLKLDGEARKGFLGFGGGVQVSGWCQEYFLDVKNPTLGCGHCHEFRGPSILDLDLGEDEEESE